MKILITGTTGMVGRNILDAFQSTTHDVLSPNRNALNLFDQQSVLKYLDTHQPDVIIHCAGKVGGIKANMDDLLGYYVENLDMGKNLVLSAYQVGIPRLINFGSSCMYPRVTPNPIKEDQLLTGEFEPTNEGYALAKISVQRLCQYISEKNKNVSYKTLIPCNLYGPYDKFDLVLAHMLPAAINKIHHAKKNNEKSVSIWGDGTARREFLYSGDVADFIVKKIADFDLWPSVMNLSAVVDHTITEYYQKAKEIIGFSGNFEFDLSKPVGMMQKLIDPSGQQKLGWTPPTSLEKGIQKTYEYFLSL